MQLVPLSGLPHASPHAVDEDGIVWLRTSTGVWLRGCTGWGDRDEHVFLRPQFALAFPPLDLAAYLERLHGRRIAALLTVSSPPRSTWTSEDLRRHRSGRFECANCGRRKNSSAPFCRSCGLLWRFGRIALVLEPCSTCGAETHRHRLRRVVSQDSIGLRKQTSISTLTTPPASTGSASPVSQAAVAHAHDTSANRGFFGAERPVTSVAPGADRASAASQDGGKYAPRRTDLLAEPLLVRVFGACRRVRGVW
ncbi:MAG TPA: hypothetical protein VM204_09170 [Gaiellaceae bacterium]|nr:hypothetical protein [Gaiellaceae bacterium]